jgi:hypothetical protein
MACRRLWVLGGRLRCVKFDAYLTNEDRMNVGWFGEIETEI